MKGEFGTLKSDVNIQLKNEDSHMYDSVDDGNHIRKSFCNKNSLLKENLIPEEINSSNEVLPIDLIQLLEDQGNWSRKPSCNKKKMTQNNEQLAQHLYARIHQVPRLYRNLYYYFFLRCDSSKSLHRYTSKFQEWELEFHNQEPLEVLKCWRLHLGSCEILKAVVRSFHGPSIGEQIAIKCLPIRNALRNLRFANHDGSHERHEGPTEIECMKITYSLFRRIWHSIKPFLGASTLYFDVFKDASIAILIYSALNSMTNENLFDKEYQFETALFVALVSAIVTVQVCWMFISSFYASEIFSMCKHWTSGIKFSFKVSSALLGPIMPAFVLANHVYYNAKSSALQRDLQTLGKYKYDLGIAMCHVMSNDNTLDDDIEPAENEVLNHEEKIKNTLAAGKGEDDQTMIGTITSNTYEDDSDYKEWLKKEKIKLFKQIVKASFRAKYFRRIYSFYRVSAAVIESYCVITVLVCILIVSGRDDRSHNLIGVLEAKLSEFIGIPRSRDGEAGDQTFLETFELVRSIVFWGSISYSATMLLTALARYVYQCKSENISKIGQCCLGLYFFSHLVTRLTLTIAIFATAEAKPDENNSPKISKLPASIITTVLFVLHFGIIYWYKLTFIREFREKNNDLVERVIHVLANTLVVIPFMTWDVEGPSSIEYQWKFKGSTFQDYVKKSRTGSLDEMEKAILAVKMSNKWENHTIKKLRGHRKTQSAGHNFIKSEMEFPNIASPLIMEVGDIKEKIESLWWENPSRKLTFFDVRMEIPKRTTITIPEEAIQKAFDHLVSEGFINKRLYNPRRSKQEYFWLLGIHLLINLVALCVEVINGGVSTPKGMYVSWDVRLSSFIMGLVFLLLYYKRYHVLKDLTRVQICGIGCKYCKVFCCIKQDEPMKAIPDDEEMQVHLKLTKKNESTSRTIETQTSMPSAPPIDDEFGHSIINEIHTDPRNMNGIKASVLNQWDKTIKKFTRKSPPRLEDCDDKKNMECQTEVVPQETDHSITDENFSECKD